VGTGLIPIVSPRIDAALHLMAHAIAMKMANPYSDSSSIARFKKYV
jgi:hypothetical protein